MSHLSPMRGRDSAIEASALTELADGGARRISLGPIDREAVTQIAADVLGAKPGRGVLQAAGRAAGNPFLLVELLRGLKEENLISSNGRVVKIAENESRAPQPISVQKKWGVAVAAAKSQVVPVVVAPAGRRPGQAP